MRISIPSALAVLGFLSSLCARAQDLGQTGFDLSQEEHRTLVLEECRGTGLAETFCERIAIEAHDTDAWEFEDILAHAQMDDIYDICGSANRVVGRLSLLGADFREALAALSKDPDPRLTATENLARELGRAAGRALHTIHDNCAHLGMSNPEHAWYSLSDFCRDTLLSPDEQPEAAKCARQQTQIFLAAIQEVVEWEGLSALLGQVSCVRDPNTQDDPCATGTQPLPHLVCGFLAEAEAWDGWHRIWDGQRVGDELLAAFLGEPIVDLCAYPALSYTQDPSTDVSGGTPSCKRIHILCFGKADEGNPPDPTGDSGGGCGTGGRGGSGGLALVGLAMALSRYRWR